MDDDFGIEPYGVISDSPEPLHSSIPFVNKDSLDPAKILVVLMRFHEIGRAFRNSEGLVRIVNPSADYDVVGDPATLDNYAVVYRPRELSDGKRRNLYLRAMVRGYTEPTYSKN